LPRRGASRPVKATAPSSSRLLAAGRESWLARARQIASLRAAEHPERQDADRGQRRAESRTPRADVVRKS
jgi:hypothetical protein